MECLSHTCDHQSSTSTQPINNQPDCQRQQQKYHQVSKASHVTVFVLNSVDDRIDELSVQLKWVPRDSLDARLSQTERQTDRRTDRYFYCQGHSTCEQMHLKATSPSTLYRYVTNGLDIECQNRKGHLLQYCHN